MVQMQLTNPEPVDQMSVSLFSTSNLDTSTAFMLSPRTAPLPSSLPFSPDANNILLSPRNSTSRSDAMSALKQSPEAGRVGSGRGGGGGDGVGLIVTDGWGGGGGWSGCRRGEAGEDEREAGMYMTPRTAAWNNAPAGTVQSMVGHPAAAIRQVFIFKSPLLNSPCKLTMELTFENVWQSLAPGASPAASPLTLTADRMELGDGSSMGTTVTPSSNQGHEAHVGEFTREFTRWNVPTPGQVRSWLMPGHDSSQNGNAPPHTPGISMSRRQAVAPEKTPEKTSSSTSPDESSATNVSNRSGLTRAAAQLRSRMQGFAPAPTPVEPQPVHVPFLALPPRRDFQDVVTRQHTSTAAHTHTQAGGVMQDDDEYFSASDPESYLMHRFENLDDNMSVSSRNSSMFSGLQTRSQLRNPAGARTSMMSRRNPSYRSNRSNRSGVRSQRLPDNNAIPNWSAAAGGWTGPAPQASESDFTTASPRRQRPPIPRAPSGVPSGALHNDFLVNLYKRTI